MSTFKALLIVICASLLVAGCQTTAPASACDGWERLAPSAVTRQFIIANDRPFAEQTAAHNSFGIKQGCWGAP